MDSLFAKWAEIHQNYYKPHVGRRVVNPWVHYQLREIESEMWKLADANYDIVDQFKQKIMLTKL